MTQPKKLRDLDCEHYKAQDNPIEAILFLSRQKEMGFFALMKLLFGQGLKKGRLSLNEIIRLGLYKNDLSSEEKKRFIGNAHHWPIIHKACDPSYKAALEDKFLCYKMLQQSSVKQPEILGVIDRTNRTYPGIHKISSLEGLKEFMISAPKPLFCKENIGIAGFGAFIVQDATEKEILLYNRKPMSYNECLNHIIQDTKYIIQPVIQNHDFFKPFSSFLATIRLYCFKVSGKAHYSNAVLKLTSDESVVDHFWRPGNIACDVNPETGEVRTSKKRHNLTIEACDIGIVGKTLPFYDAVLRMTKDIGDILSMLPYYSVDIAITQEGPVCIEINYGGGMDLPQYAARKGFITDPFKEFLKEIDYKKCL